jgi:hypothetical protein
MLAECGWSRTGSLPSIKLSSSRERDKHDGATSGRADRNCQPAAASVADDSVAVPLIALGELSFVIDDEFIGRRHEIEISLPRDIVRLHDGNCLTATHDGRGDNG